MFKYRGMNDSLIYLMALMRVPFVGTKSAKQLVAYCGDAKSVFSSSALSLSKIPNIGDRIISGIKQCDPLSLVQKDIKYITNNKIKVVSYLCEEYPKRLIHFEDCPVLLYVDGRCNLNATRTVGIIGTRSPTQYGKNKVVELINELKDYNVQIISGLAYGVDIAAHSHCVSEGIENLAIMGTGIDSVYPAAHFQIAQKIKTQGALLSEFAIGTKGDRENFPLRNRIIAGLSDALVVIQSASKGGSLITAEYANVYNKDVFAVPGRTTDDMSAGCNHLIKTHKAHLLESAKDIAYIMRWETDTHHAGKQKMLFLDLSDEETVVVDALKTQEESALDWLHHETQFSLSKLAAILLGLEFKGVVAPLPGKKYCLIK